MIIIGFGFSLLILLLLIKVFKFIGLVIGSVIVLAIACTIITSVAFKIGIAVGLVGFGMNMYLNHIKSKRLTEKNNNDIKF